MKGKGGWEERRGYGVTLTSSAARLHFSIATCCVVPWISGTFE